MYKRSRTEVVEEVHSDSTKDTNEAHNDYPEDIMITDVATELINCVEEEKVFTAHKN